jgi:DNA-binding CsgD family transcriptional regulator
LPHEAARCTRPPTGRLAPGERDVLRLIARGYLYKWAAEHRFLD